MSRSRRKSYLTPDHGKKGRFPRNSKRFGQGFTDEDVDAPISMGMRKPHNLSPHGGGYRGVAADTHKMQRVLGKQVGRPWNDVQGEFLQEFDSRTFEGHTMREWLDYIVEINVIIHEDGRITDARGLRVGYFWDDLYVCPIRKTLELSPHERQRSIEETAQTVFEVAGVLYHQHEGLWYRVKMKLFKKGNNWWGWGYNFSDEYNVRDVFMGLCYPIVPTYRSSGWKYREKYGFDPKGRAWYCTWKQSANSKEISRVKAKYFSDKKAA